MIVFVYGPIEQKRPTLPSIILLFAIYDPRPILPTNEESRITTFMPSKVDFLGIFALHANFALVRHLMRTKIFDAKVLQKDISVMLDATRTL